MHCKQVNHICSKSLSKEVLSELRADLKKSETRSRVTEELVSSQMLSGIPEVDLGIVYIVFLPLSNILVLRIFFYV